MSQRHQTGANFSLCYVDLDNTIDMPILTETMDVLTMRIQYATPVGSVLFDIDKSLTCDLKIESR